MAKDFYFKFHFDKWLSSTTVEDMSSSARGAYVCLLCRQYKDGAIPDDPARIRKYAKVDQAEFETIWPELEPCFPVDEDGFRRNPQAKREMDIRGIRSESGSKGGKASKGGKDQPQVDAESDQDDKQNASKTQANDEANAKQNASKNGIVIVIDRDTNIVPSELGNAGAASPVDPESTDSNEPEPPSDSSKTQAKLEAKPKQKTPKDLTDQQKFFERIRGVLADSLGTDSFGVSDQDVKRNLSGKSGSLANLLKELDKGVDEGKIEDPDQIAVEMFRAARREFDGATFEYVYRRRRELWKAVMAIRHPKTEASNLPAWLTKLPGGDA